MHCLNTKQEKMAKVLLLLVAIFSLICLATSSSAFAWVSEDGTVVNTGGDVKVGFFFI